ncbi:sex peptide receptor-like [Daphnia pulicaria]|nr:sex peptide receptor-like [Daphnia pulicaria]
MNMVNRVEDQQPERRTATNTNNQSTSSTSGNWSETKWFVGGNILAYDDELMDLDAALARNWSHFNHNNNSMVNNATMGGNRYLNITADLDISYALPLYGYIMPFLVVITIIANTLIVLVLSKKHMRTPTNLVLMAMALSDMFTLLFPAPWLLYLYTFGNHHRPLRPLSACYAYNFMNEVIPALFHTASIWLTLALAIQRYIYVCHPPLARTWCTMERVKKAICWIYVLALVHQFPRLFDQVYLPVEIRWDGEGVVTTCCKYEADWVTDIFSQVVYYNLYFWFRVVCVHLGPCASLVLLNVLLFGALRRAQQKRDKLFKENRKASECRKLRDSNCTTLMLIVVVSCFLVVEIPLAVLTVLHIFDASLELRVLDYSVINVLILFTNFFISLSYPINFAIYCGMSRQFRETFQGLFTPSASSGRLAAGSAHQGASSVANRHNDCNYSTVAPNGIATKSLVTNETGV